MSDGRGDLPRVRTVGVVGGGIVGLSVAWYLQEHGVQVHVLERDTVGAGASWGNAGWVTPGLASPLPEPAVLRYGAKAVLSPNSPIRIPAPLNLNLLRFLTRFTRNSTTARWRTGMSAMAALSRTAVDAYTELAAAGGPDCSLTSTSILACGRRRGGLASLLDEVEYAKKLGADIDAVRLLPDELIEVGAHVKGVVAEAVRIFGQHYVDPPRFVAGLSASVRARGGVILEPAEAVGLRPAGDQMTVSLSDAELRFDAVVLASGSWLPALARPFGIKHVQAGRGYSFSVRHEALPHEPLYFPANRIACTPLGDRLRVVGVMEFDRPDARLRPRRIASIARAAKRYLPDYDFERRSEEWVGPRPCTADGLPLIGPTRDPRVWVAGGHGMWGVTLGPCTGRALALMMTGANPGLDMRPFNVSR